jgi:8-oxo-dGTP diphosphatase
MTLMRTAGTEPRASRRPILAASLAVFREDRVLLARRARPPLRGVFSLPGGKVELGETLEAAALRELREEVAVEAQILGFNRHVEVIACDSDGTPGDHYVIASFVADWISGQGTPGAEADAILWTRPDELGDLPVTEHLLPVLQGAWDLVRRERVPC